MKSLTLYVTYFASIILIFGCKKSNTTPSNQREENQKLIQIIGDSNFVPFVFNQFEYDGDRIGKATYRNINIGDTNVTKFEYDSLGHYIKAIDDKANSYYEWFINDLQLPEKIVGHWKSSLAAELNFF